MERDLDLISDELSAIQESVAGEVHKSFYENVKLLFQKSRPAAITGIGIHILQQLIGINAVLYYVPFLMRRAGFDESKS